MNVLVVDDDLLIRGMAVTELEEAGYKVMELQVVDRPSGICRPGLLSMSC